MKLLDCFKEVMVPPGTYIINNFKISFELEFKELVVFSRTRPRLNEWQSDKAFSYKLVFSNTHPQDYSRILLGTSIKQLPKQNNLSFEFKPTLIKACSQHAKIIIM